MIKGGDGTWWAHELYMRLFGVVGLSHLTLDPRGIDTLCPSEEVSLFGQR